MTVTEAATRLLTYFSTEEREIPDHADYPGRNGDVLKAINGAAQELRGLGPAWRRKRSATIRLKAPTTITVSLTADSTAGTILAADWQDWMTGCTLMVAGATAHNQILTATGSPDKTVALFRPHDGDTGDFSATVLHDAISLAADTLGVLKPISINGRSPLSPVTSPQHLHNKIPTEDFGRRHYRPQALASEQTTGTPATYFVDNQLQDATGDPSFRILISPAPRVAMWLDWRETVSFPRFAAIDGTIIPLAHDQFESVFLPIAAQRLTDSNFFRADHAKPEITRQFTAALAIARATKVQQSPGITLRSLH